ncbi:28S ribosomal protein S21, mitochondrial [Trichinella pseudospiralis]|uniref:28S ribosomal protein S21, mitochondrial n=1 Tax=Trichinella pseudospiralis TaxID=6337 RepID=A0A0V1FF79_TRIPS|nr:28S ribosomal protein S21, mitochondrial [Trichinella pseudospiralis]
MSTVCDDNALETVKNWTFLLDKHGPATVRIIVASIGLSGLYFFCRSIRLVRRFSCFTTVNDIPDEFAKKHIRLRGIVSNVDWKGRLVVSHIPIVKLPFTGNQDSEVLIHLAAVNLEESGINWLRHNLLNNYIKFELLCKNEIDNSAVCDVSVKYKTLPMMMKNVNREIVRRGLGQVINYTDNEHIKALHMIPRYNRLVQNLLLSESYADKRGVGKWKRPKLVEAVSGYPSQIVDLVKNSNIFIFLQICYTAAKEGAIKYKRNLKFMYKFRQPFGHPLFRGITRAHQRFINKTVLVKDNNVEEALKILNKKMSQEKLLEIYRRTRYYEKPYQQRNQYSFEICKAIYNEDMNRKIALISRKNRPDRWPGQY